MSNIVKDIQNNIRTNDQKKIVFIAVTAVVSLLIVLATIIGILFIPNNSSYKLIGEGNITLNVGDDINIANYKINYKLLGGMERDITLTSDMLSDYDKNRVGEQTIAIKYNDKTFYITVNFVGRLLSAPVVVREGNKLTWQAVENASYYEIYLLDGEGNRQNTPIAITNELNFNIDEADIYGANDIVAIACSDKEGFITSNNSDKVAINKLAKINNIKYDGGILSWDAIEGAGAYTVTIGEQIYENLIKNELVVELIEGQNNIKISALSTAGTIVDSTISTIIEKISRTSITTTAHEIKWTAVQNAIGYKVFVGDSLMNMKEVATTTELSYSIDNFVKGTKYYVGVQAIGDNDKILSGDIKTEEVLLLEDVKGIKYENGKLAWDSVKNADGYIVNVNGDKTKADTNSLDMKLLVGNNKISIAPMSNKSGYVSRDTKTGLYTLLDKVSNILLDGNTISWASVQNASTYDVYLAGQKVANNSSLTSCTLSTSKGVNNVTIVAKGAGETIFSSNTDIKVLDTTLSAKSGTLVYDNNIGKTIDLYNDNNKIATFNSDDNIVLTDYMDAGVSYNLSIGLDGVIGRSNVVVMIKKNAPSIVVSNNALETKEADNIVYYLDGNVFDGNVANISKVGDHIIDAINESDGNNVVNSDRVSITVTKLANVDIVVRDNIIVVEDNTNLKYYLDEIEIEDPIGGITKDGSYTIGVKRIANGRNNILDSAVSSIVVNKLASPTISISEGNIVNNAGINVYANGKLLSDDGSSLSAGKHSLTAKRKSTGDNVLESNLSKAIEVTKLETPIISYGEQIEIANRTSNVDIYVDDAIFNKDLSTISTGQHSIKAQNKASNNNELNSNMSKVFTTYVLKASIIINEAYGDPDAISIQIKSDKVFTYDMTVEFYNDDTLITSTKNNGIKDKGHVIKLIRGGVHANRVIIKIRPIIDGVNNREISQTYTKEKEI